jgi:cell wall-associated NlpC family hydrolase
MFNQLKRMLLLSLICLLLLGAIPATALPAARADNQYGPMIAAWMASELMNVPYRAGGVDPALGLDGVGLVYYVYQQLGISVPRTLSGQWQHGVAVNKSELAAGDLLFFHDASTNQPTAVGIYLHDGGFVMASSQSKAVVAHLLSESYFQKNYLGARRIPQSVFPAFYQAIADKANSLVGLPYAYGEADSTAAGTAGLMTYIYRFFYLDVPDTMEALAKTGVFISRSNLRAGDMVFFKSMTTGLPYRVGMYLGDGRLIVTSSGLGEAVIRHLDDAFYAARYMGARRPYVRFNAPETFRRPIVPTTSTADLVVEAALRELGKPYRLGAEGPDYYDCSGLTQTIYGQFGIKLPRTSYNQATVGVNVGWDELLPGDLVFFHDTWRDNGSIDHVAIYIGDGQVVHAIGSGVTVSNLTSYWVSHFAVARRVVEP